MLEFNRRAPNNRLLLSILLSLSLWTIMTPVWSQRSYPKNYFAPPLNGPLLLSGNFGEIRSNHFHGGLDIRASEGNNVYAIADGYVSRIKVSPYGYGKALYITHPNGYVSVYAHLKRYNTAIGKYVKDAQYAKESFEIELFPKSIELPVKKGELIGSSGNTGSSAGPHLHFEIRDEVTEHAINPLLFGYPIVDVSKPVIKGLYLYHFTDSIYQESICDKNTLPKKIPIIGQNGSYTLKTPGILTTPQNIGFGIETYDFQNAPGYTNSIYSIELKVDNKRIYYQEMEEISFDETRYVNAHVDYYEQKVKSKKIQKSFVARNNLLQLYKDIKNNGILNFKDSLPHKVEYIVKDFSNNETVLKFDIKQVAAKNTSFPVTCVAVFNCKNQNSFKRNNIEIYFPPNTFYEDLKFDFAVSKDTLPGALSPTYRIHNRYVPVHSHYSISIKPKSVPAALQNKALIVSLNPGKSSEGGEWKNGYVTAQTRTFGSFAVMMDTVAPVIQPLNKKYWNKAASILIKVSDNLSGIGNYRALIDGKWVLMEYEPKKRILFYNFDERVSKGKHTFYLEVWDKKDNRRTYKSEFIR